MKSNKGIKKKILAIIMAFPLSIGGFSSCDDDASVMHRSYVFGANPKIPVHQIRATNQRICAVNDSLATKNLKVSEVDPDKCTLDSKQKKDFDDCLTDLELFLSKGNAEGTNDEHLDHFVREFNEFIDYLNLGSADPFIITGRLNEISSRIASSPLRNFSLFNRERSGSPYYYPVVDKNKRAERLNAMLDDFRKLGICLKQRTASGINNSEDPSNCLRNLLDNSIEFKKLLSYIQTDKEPNKKCKKLRKQLGVALDEIVDSICKGLSANTRPIDVLLKNYETDVIRESNELNTKLKSSNICSKINIGSFGLNRLNSCAFRLLLPDLYADLQDGLDVSGVVSLLNKLDPTDPNLDDNIKKIKRIYENSKFINKKLLDLGSSMTVNIANFDLSKIKLDQIGLVLPSRGSAIWCCIDSNRHNLPGVDEMLINYIDKFNSCSNLNNGLPVFSFTDPSSRSDCVFIDIVSVNLWIDIYRSCYPYKSGEWPTLPDINLAKWDLIKYPVSTIIPENNLFVLLRERFKAFFREQKPGANYTSPVELVAAVTHIINCINDWDIDRINNLNLDNIAGTQ